MFFLFFLTTLGLTTFGSHRLLAFFDQTVLCPHLCEPSLTPKNLGQWERQFVAHVLFFGPWTSLRRTSLAQTHPVRGVCSKFSWVRPKFGRSPDSPPPDRPKIRSFLFLLPPLFSFFLPLSRNYGGDFEAPGPSDVHVWALQM